MPTAERAGWLPLLVGDKPAVPSRGYPCCVSVSMYRNQVDRLKREITELDKRATEERGRAIQDRGEALRVRTSITNSTSPSTVVSKLRQAQARDESAVAHEKKAVTYADAAAAKGRQLTSAQTSLDQALAQQLRREETDIRRRRDQELRHIRQLEDARRAAIAPTFAASGTPVPAASQPVAPARPERRADFEWDVCLTFAGEDRPYVEMVADGLKKSGLRVFYDRDEKGKLWGKDLAEHFDYVYRLGSRYCVMFISEAYAKKPWTRHERRSALARALAEEGEYILPARFDDTELPGLRPTIHYLDLRETAPATLVQFICEKLES